jgi:PIN domain nuclease of toxin-antitoxin system
MRALVDSHVLIWWMTSDSRLSKRAAAILRDRRSEILVSSAVGWELAIKVNLGKITPASLIESLEEAMLSETFTELPIALPHAIRAGLLPLHHRDPFDRLLVAQAQSLETPIISGDSLLDGYGVERLW